MSPPVRAGGVFPRAAGTHARTGPMPAPGGEPDWGPGPALKGGKGEDRDRRRGKGRDRDDPPWAAHPAACLSPPPVWPLRLMAFLRPSAALCREFWAVFHGGWQGSRGT